MKKILIRIVVLLAVFVVSTAVFSQLVNDETEMRTEDMAQATLPLVYMVYRDVEMNPLHGYVKPMAVTAVRDTLTPISTERDMSIRVQTFGADVSDIYFEVFSADGKTSLENTKVTNLTQEEDYVEASFTLQNFMLMNQEYVLKLQLKADGRDVYYYTRVVQQDSLHTKEYLDFVNSFSEKCLNKQEVDRLALYLEPEGDAEELDLSFMDIHSTTDQVVWGNLNPQIYYKSIPAIKELNETTATIVQEYLISAQSEEGYTELYTVNEYFRLRYSDESVMLLDFERSTNEIFNPDNDVLTDKGIRLGICDSDISFVTDSRSRFYAFEIGGELWSYDSSSGKMAQVFTFRQKEDSDYRDIYGQHDIKILNVSTSGNIQFVVAGYMNRGRHEGESGVAVYFYDASSGGIEEMLFVDTMRSYDLLKADVQEISYVTDDQEDFYLLLDGDVYEINLTTFETAKVVENMKPNCYAGSESGRYFAYLEENEAYNSRTITIYNMDTKERSQITCGENERIRMLGYMGESLVYGIAEVSDIDASHEGDEIFPMRTIYIMNEDGEVVKEYGETGIYVTDATIEDKLLTMTRVRKAGDGWEDASEDHIIDNTQETDSAGLTTQVSDRKQTERILLMEDASEKKTPQTVRSRMIVSETDRTVTIEEKEHTEELYYVYAKGRLDSIYENANTAIVRANELFGVVVDQDQNYIWERGNKKTAAEFSVDEVPACILSGTMDTAYLQEQLPDKLVLDLSGCEIDSVLYFVSEGNVLLADTTDGVRIILGYDQWGNVRLYEPGAEESYLISDEDALALFEESGNVFIGFLDKPQE
ncbi:hypothetical protein [Marvinbryantia formatexigens]|nr:hypothetical protein [Marvinbryantia formatexigens]UWO25663.1 hypothetical protein NQ534_04065 [Marvinbryantia formatexigens DSM 14469]SDF32653.1 hypothetical protein SAMN05660368_00479 [Marvinbryantia formatexigens]